MLKIFLAFSIRSAVGDFLQTLDNVERIDVLPYHTLGIYKYEKLGIDYPLKDVNPPTAERIENAKKIFSSFSKI